MKLHYSKCVVQLLAEEVELLIYLVEFPEWEVAVLADEVQNVHE